MSQVRGDPLGLAESHERDVSAAQDDVLSPGGDEEAQEEHLPDEEKLETETDNVEKETCLPPLRNGTSCLHELMEPTILTEAELVTCQPQVQSRLNDELEENKTGTDTVLMNGMKHMAGQNSVKYGVENGAPSQVIQSPPNSQTSHRKLQSNPSINSHSSKKSHSSSKSTTSQIPADAHEDCCVHCILACLFCEFLTLCNIVLDCATCGSCASDDTCSICCCCCCCASGDCGDCGLPCDLDCGLVDACCESADCLEICMECCGLCFNS